VKSHLLLILSSAPLTSWHCWLLFSLADIVKEVAIMRLLSDHPNMVQLQQVLQDASSFYLVMECCDGGELFDQIIRSGHMTEAVAAAKAQQLLSFLAHAHSKHVIHRSGARGGQLTVELQPATEKGCQWVLQTERLLAWHS